MPTSKASETFGQAIQDAENLLAHFNKLNTQPPPAENEVLKRAGLIMAMTAWEKIGFKNVPLSALLGWRWHATGTQHPVNWLGKG